MKRHKSIFMFVIYYNVINTLLFSTYYLINDKIIVDDDFFVRLILNIIFSLILGYFLVPAFTRKRKKVINKALDKEKLIKTMLDNNFTLVVNNEKQELIFQSNSLFKKFLYLGEIEISVNFFKDVTVFYGNEKVLGGNLSSLD